MPLRLASLLSLALVAGCAREDAGTGDAEPAVLGGPGETRHQAPGLGGRGIATTHRGGQHQGQDQRFQSPFGFRIVDHVEPLPGIAPTAAHLAALAERIRREDGLIYFNLADVSGKGMNAALLMAKVSSLLRHLGRDISDPGELLARVNDEVCETVSHGMFVTLVSGYMRMNSANS